MCQGRQRGRGRQRTQSNTWVHVLKTGNKRREIQTTSLFAPLQETEYGTD